MTLLKSEKFIANSMGLISQALDNAYAPLQLPLATNCIALAIKLMLAARRGPSEKKSDQRAFLFLLLFLQMFLCFPMLYMLLFCMRYHCHFHGVVKCGNIFSLSTCRHVSQAHTHTHTLTAWTCCAARLRLQQKVVSFILFAGALRTFSYANAF